VNAVGINGLSVLINLLCVLNVKALGGIKRNGRKRFERGSIF